MALSFAKDIGSLFATWCQDMEKRARQPETIASALNQTWKMLEWSSVSAADAMPEKKYPFAPTDGEFKGVRTFAQQVKHVACANFAFFNEIQGKTPRLNAKMEVPIRPRQSPS